MLIRNLGVSALLLALVGATSACGAGRDDDRLRLRIDAERAEAEMARNHRDFQQSAERKLEEFGSQLEELGERAKSATAEERTRLQRLGDEIRIKRVQLSEDLHALGRSAADKWDELSDRITIGLADVERSIKDAFGK